MNRAFSFLLILMLGFNYFFGNNDKTKAVIKNVSGKVLDLNGNAIAAAQITVKETNETFFADIDGNFNFQMKADRDYTIRVSGIGYDVVEVSGYSLNSFFEINLTEL